MKKEAIDFLENYKRKLVPDLEVDWSPNAMCTVCNDTEGVSVIDDFLACENCSSTWNLDGTGGERG